MDLGILTPDFIISEEKNGIYILTDSYKNVIEAHQKENCWDFFFN